MPAGSYEIDVNHASSVTAALNTAESNLVAEVRTMEGRLDILQTSWVGEAQNAYLTAKEQWNQGMAMQQQALADLAKLLQTNAINFEDVDQAMARTFS